MFGVKLERKDGFTDYIEVEMTMVDWAALALGGYPAHLEKLVEDWR